MTNSQKALDAIASADSLIKDLEGANRGDKVIWRIIVRLVEALVYAIISQKVE